MSASEAEHDEDGPAWTKEHSLWRWRILTASYFSYAGYYLTRKAFSICKTAISAEFEITLDQVAHLWTAYLVAYMIGQFLNGFVGRRFGPRSLLLVGLGLSMGCNVVLGLTNSYSTFLVFMAFNGLVQASGWPGAVGSVAYWLRERERGFIMGIWSTNYQVGNMLVKMLGGYLLGAYGWRWSFLGLTLLTTAIWLLMYWWLRDRPEDVGLTPVVTDEPEPGAVEVDSTPSTPLREYFQLLLNPAIMAMGVGYFCIKFLRYALDSWLPTFLNLQGMGPAEASYCSMYFDIFGIGGAVIAGIALDRWLRGQWALICLLMSIGLVASYLAVQHFGHSPVTIAVLFGLVGFMLYGPDTILCGAAAIQVAGERNGVAVAGIVNGIGSLGPVIQEEVIGYLIGRRPDAAYGIQATNQLFLGMSILFALIMFGLTLHLFAAQRRRA